MSTPKHTIPLIPTALTTLGLFILISLGTWQLERLEWKNDLIAQLQSAYNSEEPDGIDLDETYQRFVYGAIEGRLMPDKAFLLGPPKMRDETIGLELIIPLKVKTRKTTHTLLVNMGWTPHTLAEQPIHALQNKSVRFSGLLRYFSWNAFTPENKPEDDIWYRLDIPLISMSKDLPNLYPAALIADSADHKFDAQFFDDAHIEQVRELPNNNHLQYAFFWYAMAGALFIIYVLRFVRKQT